ncbi:MAG: hypothetical protein NZT92_11450 [Abditibacteriales bacterium]|nr:hypothetical protein [Abditibacteriales bacterium]MDW8365878.1 hypothetical protein [Abditibacteriales bacterium]
MRSHHTVVILDCCHAGTGTKLFDEPTVFPLFLSLPGAGRSRPEEASPSGMGRGEIRHLLLAGTRALLEGMKEASSHATYEEVIEVSRQRIRQWRYVPQGQSDVQPPQWEGPGASWLLFTGAATPPPTLPLLPCGRGEGMRFTLPVLKSLTRLFTADRGDPHNVEVQSAHATTYLYVTERERLTRLPIDQHALAGYNPFCRSNSLDEVNVCLSLGCAARGGWRCAVSEER